MAVVYLDTSFFIAAIEDQAGRQAEAQKILRFELDQGSRLVTSTLTDNEFLIRYFALFENQTDRQRKLDEIVTQLRLIAAPQPVTSAVAWKAAEIQHAWRRVHRGLLRQHPQDRRFRWDALHLATADALMAVRVYAWDAKWQHLPSAVTPGIGVIVSPAMCPRAGSSPTGAE